MSPNSTDQSANGFSSYQAPTSALTSTTPSPAVLSAASSIPTQVGPSLAGRAALAVVLFVGFYVLALGIAAALLYIPYAEVQYIGRLHIKLALLCVVTAGAIVWAILPRWDRFVAPGPRLVPQEQPELFAMVQSVARATGQTMPADVYLIPDVNAWVMQRGGILGIGSRRVMGIGLPLLQLLTVSQFRAVVAHEFGHYHGGDTRLGPWIYKTQSAIGRTLQTLGESVINLPFVWYGNLFLRITHAISRRQEFTADALAAQTVGAQPLIEALRTIHGGGSAFGPYWQHEVMPVLRAGFRPSLAHGFQQFITVPAIVEGTAEAVKHALEANEGNVYDTHPPLAQRIAALERVATPHVSPEEPFSTTLLANLPELESRLLGTLAGSANVHALKPIDWVDVGQQVYLPLWTKSIAPYASLLSHITIADLPATAKDVRALGQRLLTLSDAYIPLDQLEQYAAMTIGAALAVRLSAQGFGIHAEPGVPVTCERDGIQIEPFHVVEQLVAGELTIADWRTQCTTAGIAPLPLAAEPTV